MPQQEIHVHVKMNRTIFERFAFFDTMHRQKRWVLPVLFTAIMSAFAVVAFTQQGRNSQAPLLGGVLLGVGLGLTVVYFAMYLHSVRSQATKMGLDKPRYAYTVTLAAEAVTVQNHTEKADYRWDTMLGAYRVEGCTYLYVSPVRAYLLPDGQADCRDDSLWKFLEERLPAEKLRDCRKANKA